MRINEKRLWNHIQTLGQIGKAEDGSVTRLSFTKEDEAAAFQLTEWMREAGLHVTIDACGNIIGTLKGAEPNLPPVVCGSHFDTVKEGGIFDGCLGVLTGIEVLQTIREAGVQPQRSIMVIGFRDEEGNRFGYGMIGSRSICGKVEKDGLLSVDHKGITLAQAMTQAGYHPACYVTCQLSSLEAFYEVHIEQADVLAAQNLSVGIVEGIAGLVRYTVTIYGRSAHAGATPMHRRHDPVTAMSRWILHMTKLAQQQPHTVATIGEIHTYPGACNIICDRVSFSLDLRSLDDAVIQQILDVMQEFEEMLEQEQGVRIERRLEQQLPAAICDEGLKQELEVCGKTLQLPILRLASGAGHDCMNFQGICPTAMIFVRSQHEGASHCKEEYSTQKDCADGCQLLLEAFRKYL